MFGDAGVSVLHFEEGDEIEEGDVLGVRFQDNWACEIVAPESGFLISSPYEEGDTVASVAMLAKIQPDR